LTQYDPNQLRLHAFFEGHDDIAFFSPYIERALPAGMRFYPYRCEGKSLVFEAFAEIANRFSETRNVLFFVDKDIDDILGTPWPTDPRIYVTDVYSIENYLVDSGTLMRFFRASVRLQNINFDAETIAKHFEEQLNRFHRKVMSLMGWILVARRTGRKPNLKNINLATMYEVGEDGIRAKKGVRIETVSRVSGVTLVPAIMRTLGIATRELVRVPPKRVVRGKFEAWFFVEYWNNLIKRIRELSREQNGTITVKVSLTTTNLVATLSPYSDTPPSLGRFLRTHFSPIHPAIAARSSHKAGFWRALQSFLWRRQR
jgi:hypothetical protein